jgi:hypothetical protein
VAGTDITDDTIISAKTPALGRARARGGYPVSDADDELSTISYRAVALDPQVAHPAASRSS